MSVKTRKVYYDFLRIIAAFLVIFNHSRGYRLYMISGGRYKNLDIQLFIDVYAD